MENNSNMIKRAEADSIGMLATVMNGIALKSALELAGVEVRVQSALPINTIVEPYIRERALEHLKKKRVLILTGGTGMPFFSTDTTSMIRASELNIDHVLMGKSGVSGVYDDDPAKNANAKLFKDLTFDEMINQKLQVMDLTAATMANENNLNLIIFDINGAQNIQQLVAGKNIGTKITVKK